MSIVIMTNYIRRRTRFKYFLMRIFHIKPKWKTCGDPVKDIEAYIEALMEGMEDTNMPIKE